MGQSYSGQNYHRTSVRGASAVIDFRGTGITLFGGRRPGYGRYTVTVDGQTIIANGNADSAQDSTNQVLATVSGLALGNHRAVLTNLDESPIDIDSVTVVDQLGSPGSQIRVQNHDDASPVFTYLPSTASWNINRRDAFQGGTLHYSQEPDAAVTMSFAGEAVALYGTMSPDRTNMKITIDGQETILTGGSNGHASRLHTKVLLYFRSGLSPGQHTFTLAAENPTREAPFLDIDAVAVLSTASSSDGPRPSQVVPGTLSPTNTLGSATTGSQSSSGLSKGAIIGISIGGAIALILCIAFCAFAFFWRRRRREKGRTGIFIPPSPVSPDLPMQQDPKKIDRAMISGPLENSVFVFPPPPPPPVAKPSPPVDNARHSIAPSYYGSPISGQSSISSPTSSLSSIPMLSPMPRFGSPSIPNTGYSSYGYGLSPMAPTVRFQSPAPSLRSASSNSPLLRSPARTPAIPPNWGLPSSPAPSQVSRPNDYFVASSDRLANRSTPRPF
ncbi:hypothetical protein CC1G_01947 [Coprinopsis cinerea okayama7|uniref:Transmembrane protein n=1 Tax=Coprinopsis cinerea (strain Okayama-7 / 130 / ATCC MYA-4618 / FGSC 9003) TaxID=240176 RepID=A8N622_COPC7|nr:hypothetical protein CC1G_01947 [Coprinopsis cinerea okayama7\|eukprot:XP_001830311.2 hypothetical protein CC1G_01947 [Coprinopsis cinerea okayama7\